MRWAARSWLGIILILMVYVVVTPLVSPTAPKETQPDVQFQPPGSPHWLGTDQFGRDVFTRTAVAARRSLAAGLLATGLAALLGIGAGGLAGLSGRSGDLIVMRLVDIMLAVPGILVAILLIGLFGAGLWQASLGVGIALAPGFSRLVRAAILNTRHRLFVRVSQAMGASPWHVFWWHLVPNIAPALLAFLPVLYGWSLLNLAALDFLGLTGSPSTPSLGRMLNEGRNFLRIAPWIGAGPGAVLVLWVMSLMGLSDHLRLGRAGGS